MTEKGKDIITRNISHVWVLHSWDSAFVFLVRFFLDTSKCASPRAIVKVVSGEEKERGADGGEHDEISRNNERAGAPFYGFRVREDNRKSEGGDDEHERDKDWSFGTRVTSKYDSSRHER